MAGAVEFDGAMAPIVERVRSSVAPMKAAPSTGFPSAFEKKAKRYARTSAESQSERSTGSSSVSMDMSAAMEALEKAQVASSCGQNDSITPEDLIALNQLEDPKRALAACLRFLRSVIPQHRKLALGQLEMYLSAQGTDSFLISCRDEAFSLSTMKEVLPFIVHCLSDSEQTSTLATRILAQWLWSMFAGFGQDLDGNSFLRFLEFQMCQSLTLAGSASKTGLSGDEWAIPVTSIYRIVTFCCHRFPRDRIGDADIAWLLALATLIGPHEDVQGVIEEVVVQTLGDVPNQLQSTALIERAAVVAFTVSIVSEVPSEAVVASSIRTLSICLEALTTRPDMVDIQQPLKVTVLSLIRVLKQAVAASPDLMDSIWPLVPLGIRFGSAAVLTEAIQRGYPVNSPTVSSFLTQEVIGALLDAQGMKSLSAQTTLLMLLDTAFNQHPGLISEIPMEGQTPVTPDDRAKELVIRIAMTSDLTEHLLGLFRQVPTRRIEFREGNSPLLSLVTFAKVKFFSTCTSLWTSLGPSAIDFFELVLKQLNTELTPKLQGWQKPVAAFQCAAIELLSLFEILRMFLTLNWRSQTVKRTATMALGLLNEFGVAKEGMVPVLKGILFGDSFPRLSGFTEKFLESEFGLTRPWVFSFIVQEEPSAELAREWCDWFGRMWEERAIDVSTMNGVQLSTVVLLGLLKSGEFDSNSSQRLLRSVTELLQDRACRDSERVEFLDDHYWQLLVAELEFNVLSTEPAICCLLLSLLVRTTAPVSIARIVKLLCDVYGMYDVDLSLDGASGSHRWNLDAFRQDLRQSGPKWTIVELDTMFQLIKNCSGYNDDETPIDPLASLHGFLTYFLHALRDLFLGNSRGVLPSLWSISDFEKQLLLK
jgi:hypothetical protein